jgi:hypothetical protein
VILLSKKKLTPSQEVDQSKLVDDKAAKLRKNGNEAEHAHQKTLGGAQGE